MRGVVTGLMVAALAAGVCGCASTTRIMPSAQPSIDIGSAFDRNSIQVLDRIVGKSSETKILGGLIRVVEGKGFGILGFSFFEDEYVTLEQGEEQQAMMQRFRDNILGANRVVERAYFDALSKHADADMIIAPSIKNEMINMIIFAHRTATVSGKAIRIKSDREIGQR